MSNINYNAQGQMTLKSPASGKSTTLTYDPANQRLLGMTTPGLQNLSYGYDNEGKRRQKRGGGAEKRQCPRFFHALLSCMVRNHHGIRQGCGREA